MRFFKRHNVLVALLAAAIFLGAAGTVQAAPASPVGVVDYMYLINNHPDTSKANETLRQEQEQARKEYAEKAASLGDKEKQDLERQLNQRVEQKRQELLKPIAANIDAAMKAVMDARGLTVVVYKNTVAMGGLDITEDVLKRLTGK